MAAVMMNGVGPDGAMKPNLDQKLNNHGGDTKAISSSEIVQQQTPARSLQSDNPFRMNDLPDEIVHITENFLSLNQLLSRLAQRSHNELEDTIRSLAKKPLPMPPMLNGNADHNTIEDLSNENLDKKVTLLKFAQEQHAKWVKALVITDWSKKASTLSKLIDLKVHMHTQMEKYDFVLDRMMHNKRNLAYARLPSPDLKTALEVLANGDAPWMPDLGYIPPPEMSPEDQLKWLEDLDTLLSLRLTIDDHDKIPYHFRNYRIGSGRVTFIVKGEFEVDLTIADDDPEKQYWFIDFRFLFRPAPPGLSENLRMYLELKVNEVLGAEGLAGCYKYLHELVLTHKINELRRQAMELSVGRWVDALNVERLNRSLAVQYWTSRYPAKAPNAPKSWMIIGVHSAAPSGGLRATAPTSRLALRWFRDNQEVKDIEIPLDEADLSMERILKDVIGRHTQHILTLMHTGLRNKPRFVNKEDHLVLELSRKQPSESLLTMQLTKLDSMVVRVDQIGGTFAVQPRTRPMPMAESNLNTPGRDPVAVIGWVRNTFAMEELVRRGKSQGWVVGKPPVKPDDLRNILSNREQTDAMAWFRKQGWRPQFYVLAHLSMSGDQWWLIELTTPNSNSAASTAGGIRIRTHVQLQFASKQAIMESPSFFSDLNYFTSAMISKMRDLRELHSRRINHIDQPCIRPGLSSNIRMPTIFIRTSEVLPSLSGKGSLGRWAADEVRLSVANVQSSSSTEVDRRGENRSALSTRMDSRIVIASEARLRVLDKSKFRQLSSRVDRDVAFNHKTGEFVLQLRSELGETMIDKLISRLQTIERLYEFLGSISRAPRGVQCETVTLRRVVFTYSDLPQPVSEELAALQPPTKRWKVVLDFADPRTVKLVLEKNNPHIRAVDMLQTLANSPRGLERLPFYLPTTLAVYRALDSISDAWLQLQVSRKGTFEIFTKNIDLATIRYDLPGPQARRLTLDVKLVSRRGELSWHVKRTDAEPNKSNDEFSRVLKEVWNTKSPNWKSLSTSACGPASAGVEELLKGIDKAVRTLLESPPLVLQQQQQRQPVVQPGQQPQVQNQANGVMNRGPQRPGLPGAGGLGAQMRQKQVPQAPMGNHVVDLT
ncbi:mediator complex subunit [Pyricularia oryzae]|nr:mediator complex subunit [Pyricularia oryzae]